MGEGAAQRVMTPKTRLRVWAVVVGACVVGMGLVVAGRWGGVPLLAAPGALAQGLGVAAIAWLLTTTPADAIKLKPTTSWVIIASGLVLNVVASGFHVIALLSAVVLPVLGLVAQRRGLSPWWAVVFAWSPAMGVLGVAEHAVEPAVEATAGPSLRAWLGIAASFALIAAFILSLGVTGAIRGAVGRWGSVLLAVSGMISAAVWLIS